MADTINLSKIKRDKLLSKIELLKQKIEDEDTIAVLNEVESELTKKKYGLVWEEHSEEVDEQLKTNIPVFVEDKDKEIVSDESLSYNFILEGDNLHSLRLLEKTHKGKIDVIYIDPPYNTKNKEFIYNDSRIGEDDSYKHSKWLSFMQRRLNIAKELMSRRGCIFISIDQNEFGQLKLLCDDIFGENNFIGTLIWRKKSGGGQTDEFFVTEHEYVFGYRKTNNFIWINKVAEPDINDYRYQDENGNYSIVKLEKWGNSSHREDRPTMYFPIIDPEGNPFFPIAPDGKEGRWRVGEKRLNSLINNNGIHWEKNLKNKRWIPYEKNYFNNSKGKLIKARSILYDIAETGTATKLLTGIFNEKDIFQNPKPIELVQFLLKHTTNSIVLDFFAGSGTTAQAVLELNKEDGGNRKFILCTNNENNICEKVTYQRCKTVITGQRKDGTSYSDGISSNLKYYTTTFIPKIYDGTVDSRLLNSISELIKLEHHCEIDNIRLIKFAFNDEDMDVIIKEDLSECKKIFVSSEVFLTSEQEKILENYGIEIIDIPEYYFAEELREVDAI